MHTFNDLRGRSGPALTLRFTPAEWRVLLEDAGFLRDPDNSYRPRRLMGLPVAIVPDHHTEFGCRP
jgi:hypothetical protein